MLIPKVTSAAAVAGALEPTQIFNNIELIGANISGAGTQLNTLQSAMKSTILDPIANQLINSAIQSASNDILSWANGGFNGEPLIVSNPEKYIRNQGIKSVKLNLNLIPEGSAFGDSLFSSIVKKYAYDNKDMKSKLADLSKSSIPGIIQNDVCDNASLTAYALEKVVASDGTYDPNELAAKKNEIYEYAACDGNVNDPEVQARLQDFAKQNPSLGGWDRWLAMTGGDNEFSRVTAGEELVAEANAREKYLADRNLFDGQKVLSQTSCSEYSQPQEGEDRVCIGTQGVTVPGSIATEIVSKASNAGLDRLTNIMGEGSLSSLLQGFAVHRRDYGLQNIYPEHLPLLPILHLL